MDEMEEFKITFFAECEELLTDMEERLMGMEEGCDDSETLNAIFRCAHSIKGGAGAFGLDAIVNFTHTLEALLDKMREGKLEVTQEAIDLLLQSADRVTQMLEMEQAGDTVPDDYAADLTEKLGAFNGGGASAAAAANPETEAVTIIEAEVVNHQGSGFDISFIPKSDFFATGNDPIHIFNALSKLGNLSIEASYENVPMHTDIDPVQCYMGWKLKLTGDVAEADIHETFEFVEDVTEIILTPLEANDSKENQQDEDEAEAAAMLAMIDGGDAVEDSNATTPIAEKPKAAPKAIAAKKAPAPAGGGSVRVDLDKIDRLVNMVGELVITEAMLRMQVKLADVAPNSDLWNGVEELSHHTRELQEAVMAVRMQPVKSIFSRMPRLVRDTAAKLDKDIQLVLLGEQTEVDKTVVEKLGDPLTHMIRNAVDHGVEDPDTREAAGKPRQGTIELSAYHRSGRIMIEINDDGAGINREKVLAKAKEKGLYPVDAQPSLEEIDHIIFMPGFSTADKVSDVSGRGVGMDVVRKNIESIGGNVHITNRPGNGSTFAISLPLTLAILDGMIVRVGEEFYIIPTTSIIESMRPTADSIQRVEGYGDVINVRGEFIPLVHLNRVFGIDNAVDDAHKALTVLVEAGRQKMGLVVDDLVEQQQVVIKSLEENSQPVAGISGATILGDGQVSLILDIDKLWALSQKSDQSALKEKILELEAV